MSFAQYIGGQERVTSTGKKITNMPATRAMYAPSSVQATRKLRVAAYARVSTDHEEQLTSYEAQVDYYTRYITSNPDWEFAGMYADEGISATSTAKRDGFKRMIQDALDGKFDRLLTKSVSRFARNTVDSLTMIRKLKEKGVGVTFEKENIDTLDSKGELLITLMSSLAQEESRSISENTTWGQRKRFSDGKVSLPYSHFLGYDRGENGEPVINEEEAQIVRFIYKLFLDGKSPSVIARLLTQKGIPTPGGCKRWQCTTVDSILTNEKYKGDALLQKTFTVDFLTKKMKKNEGEVQSYYVKGSHPAIVSEEVFELAQSEFRRRRESGRRICSSHIFASKLICGECGGVFGSKVWNSNTKYRRVIWQCNRKYGKNGRYDQKEGAPDNVAATEAAHCSTPHLSEDQIKAAFVKMLNGLVDARDELIEFYDAFISDLTDVDALEEQKARIEAEAIETNNKLHDWIMENARRAMTKEVYNPRFEELDAKLTALKDELERVNDEILRRDAKRVNALEVLRLVKETGPATEFDEALFGALVDTVTVYADKLIFCLKDGSDRTVER